MRQKLLLIIALLVPIAAVALPDAGEALPPDHKIEQLSKELLLSEQQKARVAEIFKHQHEKFRVIHQESHEQVKALLNPEQAAKYESLKQRHMQERERKHTPRPAQP